MTELTLEQQRAIADAADAPARVIDEAGVMRVLLLAEDFDWVRGLLPDVADAPRVFDPVKRCSYALVPAVVYERLKPLFEEDPPIAAERASQLREFGRRAGWDDPEMDVYNELDPRKQQ